MAQIVDSLRILIEQLILTAGYPGIAAAMFTENLIPPIPSELIMIFSGFLVSAGYFDMLGAILAGTIGTVPGAVLVYHIGMWLDTRVIRAFFRQYGRYLLMTENDLDRALRFLDRYGVALVLFGRFVPFVRALIALPAGMNRMPLPRFVFFVTLGSLLYNTVLVYIGIQLQGNWLAVMRWIERYETLVLVGMIGLTTGFIAVRLHRMRTDSSQAITAVSLVEDERQQSRDEQHPRDHRPVEQPGD
jgi:membrane protein DedA with SNARE-associated domain